MNKVNNVHGYYGLVFWESGPRKGQYAWRDDDGERVGMGYYILPPKGAEESSKLMTQRFIDGADRHISDKHARIISEEERWTALANVDPQQVIDYVKRLEARLDKILLSGVEIPGVIWSDVH